jgi:antitoxin VapB
MALSIKDAETDKLARALAAATGESLTEAIRRALSERLERERGRSRGRLAAEVRRIQERLARLAVRDGRAPEDLVGYDEHGAPR